MRSVTWANAHCRFGVAVRDVTPPVGIYNRSWGAAKHDTAQGVHRPLTATAAVFAPLAGDGPVLALVAVDIGWFQHLADERALRAAVMERAGLPVENLLINMSHTHASTNANSLLTDYPGGDLIPGYLQHLTDTIADAVVAARDSVQPAWITFGYGRCNLAQNRDYWDDEAQAWACGFNPGGPADDTLLVARATSEDGKTLAHVFNYACHPTTLAWDNSLLSPDYIGAAREVLERAFDAPALFLQGASGEYGPRDDYVGDTAVADRNGRQLGYAAAAAIEDLPPPAHKFVYTGIVGSGADLGTWAYQPLTDAERAPTEQLAAAMIEVPLQRKELPSAEDLRPQWEAATDRKEKERLLRRMSFQATLGTDPVFRMPVWLWRIGQAGLVAIPNEPYSVLQQSLRRDFAPAPLVVMGVTNGTLGYLPPREIYGKGIYQEWQSPFAPGCLEQTIDAARAGLSDLLPTATVEAR